MNLVTPRGCAAAFFAFLGLAGSSVADVTSQRTLSAPIDVSAAFRDFANTYFVAERVAEFDLATGAGKLGWKRSAYTWGMSFNNTSSTYEPLPKGNEWPRTAYAVDPALPFSLEFVSPRTIRLRMATSATPRPTKEASLMLVREPVADGSWTRTKIEGGWEFKSTKGSVVLNEKPWRIEIRDAAGRLLTQTVTEKAELPFSFVRRAEDYSRNVAAVFSLAPGEKIFGGGESYTNFDKRGQKLVLWSHDVLGAESREMYKPVPFFLSSRGYGMFMHTSSPITCDFGATDAGRNALTIGDDELDLFIFLGNPKEVIGAYTELTGHAAMPPLWSFGLWMSRITYKAEDEVRAVAAKLREHKIPCDVIHLDTGWFETDWQCDYKFSTTRFKDPLKMIADLKQEGFRVSLWQLPYFIPQNQLFPEIVSRGFAVKDAKGGLPTEDAILDFSNPEAVAWYQENIAGLLKMGVGAIKVDFGEAAPESGLYASGRTGFYEHNLYPLRYQKTVAEITHSTTGGDIIWARAGWAGSQRYPLHWSGDAHNTDSSMAGTLRAGLSLGVCGFSFWSHDIGGFFGRPSPDLYRRWLAFGLLTSHSRCHGSPPREPWEYGTELENDFRATTELKYRLMPYVYAQAKDSAERGLPMTRALFIEFPDDPGAWLVDDAYLLGSSLYVAPLFEPGAKAREVYLPSGRWIDYQTGRVYERGWHRIEAGKVAAVILVRDGTVLPHIALAQSTAQMDWSKLELVVYATETKKSASGLVYLPTTSATKNIEIERGPNGFALRNDPLAGQVKWTIRK
ncbi:MAG: glycoside hydrolase family 31 protein [Nibricoccus sp.]